MALPVGIRRRSVTLIVVAGLVGSALVGVTPALARPGAAETATNAEPPGGSPMPTSDPVLAPGMSLVQWSA